MLSALNYFKLLYYTFHNRFQNYPLGVNLTLKNSIVDGCPMNVHVVKYYLINEQECFIRYKTRGAAEPFIF